MPKFIDLTGKRFDRLIVLQQAGKSNSGKILWLCQCDCGIRKIIFGSDIRTGHTKSCGCLKKELTILRSTKHGHSNVNKSSNTYMIYHSMIQRCTNPNNPKYKYYGGRNKPITVCDRWLPKNNGFINFLNDMGECPPGLSIDRVDNDGDYEPSNCRWSTIKEQARNRKSNINVKFNNRDQCLQDWSNETGIKAATIKRRLSNGYSPEEALTTPVRKTRYSKKKTNQEEYDDLYKNIPCPISETNLFWKYINV